MQQPTGNAMTEGTVPNVRAPSGMPIGTEVEGADADGVSPRSGPR